MAAVTLGTALPPALPARADDGQPVPAAAPSGSGSGSQLTWAPPTLVAPTTVDVTSAKHELRLAPDKDYIVRLPAVPLVSATGVTIEGGHDVVLIGGEIQTSGRGLYLKAQTGTVHVQGLRLSGPTIQEGIDLDQRLGATVQLEDIAVDPVHGSESTNHADVLQTWAGPGVLRVDRFEGSTTFQGFFFDPDDKGSQPSPSLFDVRNTVLRCAQSPCASLLWQSGVFPITTSGVTVVPGPGTPFKALWTGHDQTSWAAVQRGGVETPSPLLGRPGTGYVNPGYQGLSAAVSPDSAPTEPASTSVAPLPGSPTVTRYAGSDRYTTAVAISASSFPSGSPHVVVASGADFPDAMGAGQLAAARRAPLLLVPRDGPLPGAVAAELDRLRPGDITVVGGPASVPDTVLALLRQHARTSRVAGPDRYATAAAVAAVSGTAGRTLFLASGEAFPDAIAGAAVAAGSGDSLLLGRSAGLPEATRQALVALAPARVVLLGGRATLSDSVGDAVAAAVPGAAVQRWSGADRYATAAAVATSSRPSGAATAVLAVGTSFPDALAGGPAAGLRDAPILLVQPSCVPAPTLAALAALRPTALVLLGAASTGPDRAAALRPC